METISEASALRMGAFPQDVSLSGGEDTRDHADDRRPVSFDVLTNAGPNPSPAAAQGGELDQELHKGATGDSRQGANNDSSEQHSVDITQTPQSPFLEPSPTPNTDLGQIPVPDTPMEQPPDGQSSPLASAPPPPDIEQHQSVLPPRLHQEDSKFPEHLPQPDEHIFAVNHHIPLTGAQPIGGLHVADPAGGVPALRWQEASASELAAVAALQHSAVPLAHVDGQAVDPRLLQNVVTVLPANEEEDIDIVEVNEEEEEKLKREMGVGSTPMVVYDHGPPGASDLFKPQVVEGVDMQQHGIMGDSMIDSSAGLGTDHELKDVLQGDSGHGYGLDSMAGVGGREGGAGFVGDVEAGDGTGDSGRKRRQDDGNHSVLHQAGGTDVFDPGLPSGVDVSISGKTGMHAYSFGPS